MALIISFSDLIWELIFFHGFDLSSALLGMTHKSLLCELRSFLNSGPISPIACWIFPFECPSVTLNLMFKYTLKSSEQATLAGCQLKGLWSQSTWVQSSPLLITMAKWGKIRTVPLKLQRGEEMLTIVLSSRTLAFTECYHWFDILKSPFSSSPLCSTIS